MCLAQGPQSNEAGEARIRSPSLSSQALYHWAIGLPDIRIKLPQVTLYSKILLYKQGVFW